MLKKSSEFYVRIALSVIVLLLVVNLFKLPGHTLIKRAVAAIGTITGEGNTSYLVRFVGAAPTNSVGDSIIYDSGTNVGIGTASPGYKLTVSTSGGAVATDNNATFLAKNAGGTYETWMWPRYSDGVMYTNFGSSGWNIRNNASTPVMFMTSGGNVGIGTTAPGAKLEIYGSSETSSETGTLMLRSSGNTAKKMTLGWSDTADAGFIAPVHSGIAWKNLLLAPSGGNVGIGTTNPGYKLDVTGSANVSGNITTGALNFYGNNGNSGQPAAGSDYRIYQAPGAWTYPYPDLNIAYHTGISIGAHYSYGGTRFYNNSDMVTELMSVGNTDNNVRIANNLIVNGNISSAQGLNVTKTTGTISLTTNSFGYPGGLTINTSGANDVWTELVFTPPNARATFQPSRAATSGGGGETLNRGGYLGWGDRKWANIFLELPPMASGYLAIGTNPANGSLIYVSSSKKTKTNIKPFEVDWKGILKLSPVFYNDKNNPTGSPIAGYIAEDAVDVGLGDLVALNEKGEITSFYYDRMGIYLLEGLREHEKEIVKLKDELNNKTQQISSLEARIEKLEQLINK